MNQNDAKKILGMGEGDIDVVGSFTRRRKLITKRLNAAPTDALKAQYKGLLIQLEHAAGLLAGVNQPGVNPSRAKDFAASGTNPNTSVTNASDDDAYAEIELAPGQILAQRYEVREKIGQGSHGVVYRVYDQKRGAEIAIKVLLPELLAHEDILERFLFEVGKSCDLYHPGIVNEFDLKDDDGIFFITMELLEGQTLRQAMDVREKARRPFSEKEVIQFARTIATGLTYAHIKTVHGDIKPENIWIDTKGNFRIMNFSMAGLMRIHQKTRTAIPMNTDYMAPEQLKDPDNIDDRADQYALGVLMYELLTRDVPAARKSTTPARSKKMSKHIATIIVKMVKIKPEDRFRSIGEVESSLAKIQSDRSKPKFNPKVLGIVATLVLGMAMLFYAVSTGHLSELWDDIRPLPDKVEQQQFNDAIQLVNEVNSLIRSLDQAQKKLGAKIREGEISIQQLKEIERTTRSDSQKLKTKKLLSEVRADLSHNLRLRGLTNRIIFDDSYLLRSKGKVQVALSLIEAKEHPQAIEHLNPVQAELKADLKKFSITEDYMWAHIKLGQVQKIWQRFNQAQKLKQPVDLDQRIQEIARTEQLAAQGEVADAVEQLYLQIQSYQKDHVVDQKLVKDRVQYGVQQAKTLKLEKEWKGYLKKQRLKMATGQQNLIKRSKTDEQAQLDQQNFKAADAASRSLEQSLVAYYAASKAIVSEAIKKRTADNARKAKESSEKAKAAAEQAMVDAEEAMIGENYDQAIKQYQKVLDLNPKDKEANKQLKQAVGKTSLELLKKFAPGLVLVEIPAGRFKMGNQNRDGSSDERPIHEVTIKGFKLMKYEVTFDQFDAYVEETGNNWRLDEGWGRENRPVINVSWNDATEYAKWLSQKTGYRFRLPSEAEWEYAARGGVTTKYSWGNSASHEKANYGKDNCCGGKAEGADKWRTTSPVGSFSANQFGLNDMHGNVWEWVQDCWNTSYNGAPGDGSAWLKGNCNKRILRGGSWSSEPGYLRSANRDGNAPDKRNNSLGFRLLQEL